MPGLDCSICVEFRKVFIFMGWFIILIFYINLNEDRTVKTDREHQTEFDPMTMRYLPMLSKFYLLVDKFYNFVKIRMYSHENDNIASLLIE